MTESISRVIADLVRAGVAPELVGRVVSMVVEVTLGDVPRDAEASPVTSRVTLSAGALRTRKWREKLRNLGNAGPIEASRGVTERHQSVTGDVTRDVLGKKGFPLNPPHTPPIIPIPKKPQTPGSRRHRVTVDRLPHRPNWRHESDPQFREVEALRGRSLPRDKTGGWEISPALLDEATARLVSAVAPLRAVAAAIPAAVHDPPVVAKAG